MRIFLSTLFLTIVIVTSLSAMEKNKMSITEIGQIALEVENIDRATEFYKEQLGMEFLFTVPNQFSFFNCNGIRLLLGLPENGEKRPENNLVYFRVDDIESAHQLFSSKGVVFLDMPHIVAKLKDHDLWMAIFKDSEGNTLALMSEVKKE